MKSIYILGASGLAKEVFGLIRDTNEYIVKAFVDIKSSNAIKIFNQEIPVISEDEFFKNENPNDTFLAMGIGDPASIQKLAKKFEDYTFPNLIHPSSIIANGEVRLGKGNIITAGVIITVNCEIKNFNIFNLSTTIGHDVRIGSFNVINPAVNISGNVIIGDRNLLGVGAVVLQEKKIGDNSIIGASSLVTKDVPSNVLVIGVPGKIKE